MNNYLNDNELAFATALRRVLFASALILLPAAACTSGRPVRPTPAHDQYTILQAELETTKQQNLYDAIRQLRPFWLTRDRRRGATGNTEILVYLDGQQLGGVAQLTRVPVIAAERILYMSATEAQVRFGSMNGLRPAIIVDSKRP